MTIPRIPANTVLAASVAISSSSGALPHEPHAIRDGFHGPDPVPGSSASAPPPPAKKPRLLLEAWLDKKIEETMGVWGDVSAAPQMPALPLNIQQFSDAQMDEWLRTLGN